MRHLTPILPNWHFDSALMPVWHDERVFPTLNALLAHRPLALQLIAGDTPGRAGLAPVTWAHSTDLRDPTPFLEPGSIVLTTGAQLPAEDVGAGGPTTDDDEEVRAYVDRLRDAGVLALGYGSDVVRGDPPPALVAACDRIGLPLFEVPYATPFVAVAAWVAQERALAGRARADWGVRTMRAVTSSAHRLDGLAAALATYAERTVTEVALVQEHRVRGWDATGRALSPAVLASPGWALVRQEADRLLRDGRRAATSQSRPDAHVTFQTLGRASDLRGVLVRVGTVGPDAVEAGVLGAASALAGLALEQDHRAGLARDDVASAVLALALAGHADAVRAAARRLGTPLPSAPVVVVRIAGSSDDLAAARSVLRTVSSFHAAHGDEVVALAPAARSADVATAIGEVAVRAGASDPASWADLPRAHREAGIAAADAGPGEVRLFADLAGRPLDWVAMSEGSRDVARSLLTPLLAAPDGRGELEPALRAWLAAGCQWDPAARDLGLHRHTLRRLVERSGRLLGRDLATMDARAEVWWALRALDRDDVRRPTR